MLHFFGSLDHMIVGEDISLICDEKTASTHRLIAGIAKESSLPGDRPDNGHNRRADLLNRFRDGCFNNGVV